MIVSNIIGGLGNQLFQFAIAFSVAKSLNVDFGVDLSEIREYKVHNGYELERIFGIKKEISRDELSKIFGFQVLPSVRRVLRKTKFIPFFWKNLCLESINNEKIVEQKKDLYIDGYWQNEKYFIKYKSDIKKIFKFDLSGEKVLKPMVDKMRGSNSVAIHVRRGDYVSNKNATSYHGVCSKEYFTAAIEFIKNKVTDPVFFVFSDDQDWVEKELSPGRDLIIVRGNVGNRSYIDMALMVECKHAIISNSTFSWWGAWLNNNDEKIVISPVNWFSDPARESIVPSDWIKL